jgi:hypothetical protein
LQSLAEVLALYMLSGPTFARDAEELSSLDGFSRLPTDPGEPTDAEDVDLPPDGQAPRA